jgi:hypothetical protein
MELPQLIGPDSLGGAPRVGVGYEESNLLRDTAQNPVHITNITCALPQFRVWISGSGLACIGLSS